MKQFSSLTIVSDVTSVCLVNPGLKLETGEVYETFVQLFPESKQGISYTSNLGPDMDVVLYTCQLRKGYKLHVKNKGPVSQIPYGTCMLSVKYVPLR